MNLFFKILISLFVISVFHSDIQYFKQPLLQPTDGDIFAQKKEKHRKRDLWIALMHKSAPQHDWRKIEQENRILKANKKNNKEELDSSLHFLSGNWREVGSKNQAGRILITEFDHANNQIICASDGGNIWTSDYDSVQWRVINDRFKINDICFLKKIENSRILVASSAWGIKGFFYTDDEGESWEVAEGLDNVADWGKITRCIRQQNGTLYLTAVEWNNDAWEKMVSIYKSTDNGVSFSRIVHFSEDEIENENKLDIWTSDQTESPVFVLANGVFYTLSGNSLIEKSSIPQDAGSFILEGFVNGSDTSFFIANSDNNYTTIYASLNAGANWVMLSTIDEYPFRNNSFIVSPTNKNNLFFGGVNCYRSHDLGASWEKVNNWDDYYAEIETKLHADIPSIDMFRINNKDVYFISTDGGLYISKDSLKTVKNISLNNHNVSQCYSVYTSRVNPTHIHAGSQDQGFQHSNAQVGAEPINFRQVISGDYGHIVSSDFGASIWMVYPGFVLYYSDIINTETSYMQNFDFNGHLWMPPLMADPEDPTACFLGGGAYNSGAKLIHVKKMGERLNFEELAYNFTNASNTAISAMAYSKMNTDYRYVLNSDGEFYYSTDAGANWEKTTDFTAPEHHYFYGATILPSKTTLGKVYVGGSGYSNAPVFVTNDNGETFTEMSDGLPQTLVFKLDSDEQDSYIFAATEAGPYVYDIEQEQWFDIAFDIAPDQTYWDVDYIENLQVARFATYGRGIWDYMVNTESSVEQLLTEKKSAKTFPNPSNGDFYIQFAENTTWPKQIDIYNLNGQLIYAEELSYFYPNKYQIILQSNPGYYLVKITQPEGTEVVKMLIQ